MRSHEFTLSGARLSALPSGALWWAERGILCVSDLSLCRPDRLLRQEGENPGNCDNQTTLARLERDILKRNPQTIICLGASFDDLDALTQLGEVEYRWLTCLMAGRKWIWIPGSNATGPVDVGGTTRAHYRCDGLSFHQTPDPDITGQIAGSLNPWTWYRTQGESRRGRCFLIDEERVVLPRFGKTRSHWPVDSAALQELMSDNAIAVLTGRNTRQVPMHLSP